MKITLLICFVALFLSAVHAQPAENFSLEKNCSKRGVLNREGLPTQTLLRGAVHCYELNVERGMYTHFQVWQEGIDVLVQPYRIEGEATVAILPEIDSPNARSEYEPIGFAESDEKQFLVIWSGDSSSDKREYSITVDEYRTSRSGDQHFLVAEQMFVAGQTTAIAMGNLDGALVKLDEAWVELGTAGELSEIQWDMKLDLMSHMLEVARKDDIEVRAAAELKRILSVGRIPKNERILFSFHVYVGAELRFERQAELAREHFRKAREARTKLNDRTLSIDRKLDIQLNIEEAGNNWFGFGEASLAVAGYEAAVKDLLPRPNGNNEAASLLSQVGVYFFELGLPGEANEYYKRAISIEGLDKGLSGWIRMHYAVSLTAVGRPSAALKEYDRAELDYAEYRKNIEKGFRQEQVGLYVLQGRGRAHLALNELDEASRFTKEALKLSEPKGAAGEPVDAEAAGFEHLYLGMIHSLNREPDKASAEFGHAKRVFKKLSLPADCFESTQCLAAKRGIANTLNNAAFLMIENRKYPEARSILQEAFAVLGNLEMKSARLHLLINEGKIYLGEGDVSNATKNFEQALAISEEIMEPIGEMTALFNLAELAYKANDPAGSEKHLSRTRQKLEDLRNEIEDPDQRRMFFKSSRKVHELSIDVLTELEKRLPGKGHLSTAFDVSERSKSRSIVDAVFRTDEKKFGASVTKDSQEKTALQEKISLLIADRMLAMSRPRPDARRIEVLKTAIMQSREELRKVSDRIRSSNMSPSAIHDPFPATIEKLKSELPSETVLLEYFIGEKDSYLWAVTRDSPLRIFRLGVSQNEIDEKVSSLLANIKEQEFYNNIHYAGFEKYKTLSRSLATYLFPKDVLSLIGDRKLIVVPDGSLSRLPFDALPDLTKEKEGGWSPFVKHREIAFAPSAAGLLGLQRIKSNRKPAPNLFRGFVAPKYGPSYPVGMKPPPGTKIPPFPVSGLGLDDRSREVVLRSVSGLNEPAKKIDNAHEVTLKSVMDEGIKDYRVILFYAHGKADDADPAASGVYLSRYDSNNQLRDDFYLGVNDIARLPLSSELVFLAASDTALGPMITGDGMASVNRAFFLAGSTSVISTLWSVPEARSSEIVGRFLDEVFTNEIPTDVALRHAKAAVWKANYPPYHWAGFHFNGIPSRR